MTQLITSSTIKKGSYFEPVSKHSVSTEGKQSPAAVIPGMVCGAAGLCYLLAPGTCRFCLADFQSPDWAGECFQEGSSREVVCESGFSRDGDNHVQKD